MASKLATNWQGYGCPYKASRLLSDYKIYVSCTRANGPGTFMYIENITHYLAKKQCKTGAVSLLASNLAKKHVLSSGWNLFITFKTGFCLQMDGYSIATVFHNAWQSYVSSFDDT